MSAWTFTSTHLAQLVALERALPERLRAAETDAANAERELAALLLRRAIGGQVSTDSIAAARTAAAAAAQEREDLRRMDAALPDIVSRARAGAVEGISRRHTVSVAERKATKAAYLNAIDSLSKRNFRGLTRDQVKQLGREALEHARRAHRVPACKEALLEISSKVGAQWLAELA